jgi:hypothetical protein
MKKCPYCGQKYPDDAVVCEVDQSLLVLDRPETLKEAQEIKQSQAATARLALSIGGFSVLAGLSGFGLTWLVVGTIAGFCFKTMDGKIDFFARSMPLLIVGGMFGFAVGFVVSLKKAKADPETERETEKEKFELEPEKKTSKPGIEEKYVGFGGRIKIYLGTPIFVVALLAPFFERLLSKYGAEAGAFIALGIFLVIIAVSLVLYDRIPAKLIIPIGIIGWMLTLLIVLWHGFLRPGAF